MKVRNTIRIFSYNFRNRHEAILPLFICPLHRTVRLMNMEARLILTPMGHVFGTPDIMYTPRFALYPTIRNP